MCVLYSESLILTSKRNILSQRINFAKHFSKCFKPKGSLSVGLKK